METHVKILAVLYLVFSAVGILLALAFFLATGVVTAIVGTAAEPSAASIAIPIIRLGGTALACFFLALSVPGVVVGLGLLNLRPWARVLGIVVSALVSALTVLEPGLDDWAAPGIHRCDLVRVDVHPDNLMSVGGQRRCRHAADVPETKD